MDTLLRPLRNELVQWRALEDDGVLLDLHTGQTWALNAVGLFIWDLCDGAHEIARIERWVARHFGVDLERAAADVEDFLLHLEEQELIVLQLPEAV